MHTVDEDFVKKAWVDRPGGRGKVSWADCRSRDRSQTARIVRATQEDAKGLWRHGRTLTMRELEAVTTDLQVTRRTNLCFISVCILLSIGRWFLFINLTLSRHRVSISRYSK